MLIPALAVIALTFSVFLIAKRENLNNLKNSLSNILKIDKIK